MEKKWLVIFLSLFLPACEPETPGSIQAERIACDATEALIRSGEVGEPLRQRVEKLIFEKASLEITGVDGKGTYIVCEGGGGANSQ